MTHIQKVTIRSLINVFGNHGPCHSDSDHAYLTALLNTEVDERTIYKPSLDCTTVIDQILLIDPDDIQ